LDYLKKHTSLLILLSITLYPLYLEAFEISYLNNAVNVRNRQLFDRSTFSEFKILSAGIAHEINNALTVINAKTEQLMRVYKKEEDQKGLKMVLNSADRIGKSIKGLREFIYPKEPNKLELLQIKDLLDQVLMLYGQRLRNHGAVIITRGIHHEIIKGNRMQLEQVFLSLVNNALEGIDKLNDKWIEVICETHKNTISILFRDSSPGLSDEMADKMFRESIDVKISEDIGLGLILANEILHKHGGSLSYVKGSSNRTFNLILPTTNVSDPLANPIPKISHSEERTSPSF
jgi:C4-dicarboxylate-specific signal transduction histidine kinase